MKFIHIADTHLGMQPDKGMPWSENAARQLWGAFAHIIEICRDEKPDLLLIAGDMFHRQPLIRELKEIDALFASVPDVRVVIIAGNHDYISGVSNYNGFEWSDNVTFFRTEQVESVYFEDINTEVYGLSFCHRRINEELLKGIKPSTSDRINLLLVHGGQPGSLPINTSEINNAGFDYIACGHLHTPIDVSSRMRYPGCLEPLEINDLGKRGFIEGSIVKNPGEEALLESKYVVCNQRQYRKIDLTVDSSMTGMVIKSRLAKEMEAYEKGDIFCICLKGRRDPDMVFDTEMLMNEGNIARITDETVPDYDFETLKRDNAGNIIGLYIENIANADEPEVIRNKALEYGISALLHRK